MRNFLVPSALVAAMLGACSQPGPTPSPSPDDAATSASVTGTAPAASPAPGIAPAPSRGPAVAIPERFRGVWDNAKGSCNPASDLRMEIGAVSIEFYESLGTVTNVTVESPDSILIDLAMEGEGERWTVKSRYVLSKGGATLTPSEAVDTPSTPIPRKRCQA